MPDCCKSLCSVSFPYSWTCLPGTEAKSPHQCGLFFKLEDFLFWLTGKFIEYLTLSAAWRKLKASAIKKKLLFILLKKIHNKGTERNWIRGTGVCRLIFRAQGSRCSQNRIVIWCFFSILFFGGGLENMPLHIEYFMRLLCGVTDFNECMLNWTTAAL